MQDFLSKPVNVERGLSTLNNFRITMLNNYKALARRHKLCIFLVALLAVALSAALSVVVHPAPNIHDEFSFLLAADTFAHGHITNPTHPLWKSFETFHILQKPTYASKYQPAQGLILALGQLVDGQPITGVWLSMGLCCGAICWMLQSWLPAEWALLGALLSVIRLVFYGQSFPGTDPIGYWSQSYFGGAMAALGGALFLGGLKRLTDKESALNAIWLALGIAILANSRPSEGLVTVVVSLALFAKYFLAIDRATLIKRIIPWTVGILLATATLMGFYNLKVTGNVFRMPYVAYEAQYGGVPNFLFQPLGREPIFNNRPMQQFFEIQQLGTYMHERTLAGFIDELKLRLWQFWSFYLDIWLTLPLLALPFALKDRFTRIALFILGAEMLVILTELGFYPHYAAPTTALIFFVIVQCLRQISRFKYKEFQLGQMLVGAFIFLFIASFVQSLVMEERAYPYSWFRKRASLVSRLKSIGGKHLIVVRYGPQHVFHHEWVFNDADIDNAPVIFARELDGKQNIRLLNYFKGRTVWLLIENNPLHSDADPILVRIRR